jgi:hypothetical protein
VEKPGQVEQARPEPVQQRDRLVVAQMQMLVPVGVALVRKTLTLVIGPVEEAMQERLELEPAAIGPGAEAVQGRLEAVVPPERRQRKVAAAETRSVITASRPDQTATHLAAPALMDLPPKQPAIAEVPA